MRAVLLVIAALSGSAASADTSFLPDRLLCHLVELCEGAGACSQVAEPIPFTLRRSGTDWLWDPEADWAEFPVMIARNHSDPYQQLAGGQQQFDFALIVASRRGPDDFTLDGHQITGATDTTLEPNAMRYHCRVPTDVAA